MRWTNRASAHSPRFREKQEQLESLFESDELDKKKKEQMQSMEDELKSFQQQKTKSPFSDEEDKSE